jgi:hypothetical protein
VWTELPDSPAGRAAAWLVEVLRGGVLDGVEQWVAPSMRGLVTQAAIDELSAALGAFTVAVGHATDHHVVLRLPSDGDDTALTVYVEAAAPHRIIGARFDDVRGAEPWRTADGPRRLREIRDELELAGLVAAVISGDRTVVESIGGVHEHTPMSIGSITKTMTAALVRQLVDDGLVSFDDELDGLLDDVAVPPGITVGLVVAHRSGLASDAPIEGEPDIAALFDRYPLRCDFEPGAERVYSNTGFALLGHLVERVRGVPYGDALAERILGPCGMHESGVDATDVAPAYLSFAGVLRREPWLDVAMVGAGGVVSTASDVARYLRGVLDGVVPVVGWAEDGNRRWHNGGWDGFSAVAWFDPDERCGSVLLTNTGRVTGNGLLEMWAPRLAAEVCGVD